MLHNYISVSFTHVGFTDK